MAISREVIFGLIIFLVLFVSKRWRQYAVVKALEIATHLALIYFYFFHETALGARPLVFLFLASVLQWKLISSCRAFWRVWLLPTAIFAASRLLPNVEMALMAKYLGENAPAFVASSGLMSELPIVGLSYLCFRWISAGLHSFKSQDSVPLLGFLTYCFFLPFSYSGPITSFSTFSEGIRTRFSLSGKGLWRCVSRILWGAVKFSPLSGVFYQLTLTRQLAEGTSLSSYQVALGVFCYPAFLFLNFSGFTDMVIGVSGLLGYPMDENFNRPYLAVSLRDFWRRWHMTLTRVNSDLIYKPLTQLLARTGLNHRYFTYGFGTFCVFTVMAVWHGSSWNYLVFFLSHALICFLEELLHVRRREEEWKDEPQKWMARLYVWGVVALTMVFFENGPEALGKLRSILSQM